MSKLSLSLFLVVTLISGCNGAGGGTTTDHVTANPPSTSTPSTPTPTPTPVASCAPAHTGSVKWTYVNCGPLTNGETANIDSATVGEDTTAFGTRTFDKGRATFFLTNVDASMLQVDRDVAFASFGGSEIGGGTLQWFLLGKKASSNGNRIETRLASRRMTSACASRTDCYEPQSSWDNPLWDGSKKYKFDLSWDTTQNGGAGLIKCDIYDATASETNPALLVTLTTTTSGPYPILGGFSVGGNSGGSAGLPATLTNFRITLFN